MKQENTQKKKNLDAQLPLLNNFFFFWINSTIMYELISDKIKQNNSLNA